MSKFLIAVLSLLISVAPSLAGSAPVPAPVAGAFGPLGAGIALAAYAIYWAVRKFR